jgi:hypothetical protein
MSLVAAKPELGQAMEHATGRAGGLGDIERHFAAYLDAEKKLGRIEPGADTETLAFTLLGTVHHLILTRRAMRQASAGRCAGSWRADRGHGRPGPGTG